MPAISIPAVGPDGVFLHAGAVAAAIASRRAASERREAVSLIIIS